jgi:putative addiction module antidote
MTQKVLKVGSSAAVTIPKKSLEELGIKIGDKITVHVDQAKRVVTIKPTVHVDTELLDWTNAFIKKYRPALEKLSKK